MSYRVTLTATAVKERKRIDPVVRKRIDQALRGLEAEPRPSGVKKLSGQHPEIIESLSTKATVLIDPVS